jgi:hypothetical protein
VRKFLEDRSGYNALPSLQMSDGSLFELHKNAVPRTSFTNTIFIIDMLTVPQTLIVLEQFSQSQNAII